jgi:hypothetical protein
MRSYKLANSIIWDAKVGLFHLSQLGSKPCMHTEGVEKILIYHIHLQFEEPLPCQYIK